MQEPEPIHLEESFNEFVKVSGGELVSLLLPSDRPFDNADYLFREEAVVAELKCLQKDILEHGEYQRKLSELYESWIRQDLVQEICWGNSTVEISKLPIKCHSV